MFWFFAPWTGLGRSLCCCILHREGRVAVGRLAGETLCVRSRRGPVAAGGGIVAAAADAEAGIAAAAADVAGVVGAVAAGTYREQTWRSWFEIGRAVVLHQKCSSMRHRAAESFLARGHRRSLGTVEAFAYGFVLGSPPWRELRLKGPPSGVSSRPGGRQSNLGERAGVDTTTL